MGSVGSLEEIIDDNHAIVSTSVGSEHYVSILSFVDKDQLESGCSVLLNHKVHCVVGVLSDDTDPMVTVMKLEKAPTESYADIGGLDTQIQEIKESVELVDRDLVVSESENTVHLGDEEGAALDVLDLTEAHGGADVTDLCDVLGDETLNGARAVSDIEVLTILLVCG